MTSTPARETLVDVKSAQMLQVWLAGLPPKTTNRSMGGWQAYHFPRRRWMVNAERAIAAALGKVPQHQHVSVKITAYVPKMADADNADSRFKKAAHDLLVRCGMIPDDSAQHLTPHPVTQVAVGSAPRRPKDPNDLSQWGKRRIAHDKKLGLMLSIEVLA